MKKTWMVIPAIIFAFQSCQTEGEKLDLNTFSQRYTAIQQQYRERMNQPDARKKFTDIIKKKNREFEKLLASSKTVPYSEEREIITSKILIHLKQYRKAEEIIDPVLASKNGFINEAKMVKVQILLARENREEALKIFREIEPEVARDHDFFSTCLYFALKSQNFQLSEEYSNKLLNAKDMPAEFNVFKARLYSSLAAASYVKNELGQAKTLMNEAIKVASNPLEKHILTSRLSQLEMIGKPAPQLTADTWINSPALRFNQLRGKKIIIDFWAPWCEPCRETIPVLAELSNRYRPKDLMVIGFTKLYGMYRDAEENRSKLGKSEEISLINQFVKKQKITYPIAISHQGEQYGKYFVAGIPVMVFINPSGVITHIQLGASPPDQLRKKIIEFMEE